MRQADTNIYMIPFGSQGTRPCVFINPPGGIFEDFAIPLTNVKLSSAAYCFPLKVTMEGAEKTMYACTGRAKKIVGFAPKTPIGFIDKETAEKLYAVIPMVN